MGQVYLMGEVDDLEQLIPTPAAQTLTQARNLERQAMAQQDTSGGASFITNLGNQAVQVLDAATRLKIASQQAKARVKYAANGYDSAYYPGGSWITSEWIPGVSNTTLLIGAVGLTVLVVMLRRQ